MQIYFPKLAYAKSKWYREKESRDEVARLDLDWNPF
ncbi:uncharacterized protein CLUP02_05939 [Colletotrichum lupini]|uniref:Uncharacterized protein n=1 Tax=Colletotrichum lupini TaxID=145971 RepID=A0A9Q8SPB9_9PEZI|nr:uncharacterized protein CLUP02_05939 [Colletotrichum lupini]UQC80456.1 hypothetical protein CLUP02_05939 [Colletotrichum lupini]